MDIKYFLKNLPAFENFNNEHIAVLAANLEISDFEDGDVFITQGTQGEALFMLLEGAVRITRHEKEGGEEQEVRKLAAGELFGIVSLVDDLPAMATCTAIGKGKVAALSRPAFKQLFKDASPIGHHLHYMIAVQMAHDIQEENKRYRNALVRS